MSVIDVILKILAEGYSPSEYGGLGIAIALIASAIWWAAQREASCWLSLIMTFMI